MSSVIKKSSVSLKKKQTILKVMIKLANCRKIQSILSYYFSDVGRLFMHSNMS